MPSDEYVNTPMIKRAYDEAAKKDPEPSQWNRGELEKMLKNNARKPSIREDVLSEASLLTSGDRNKSYGPPARNLERAAALMRAYFGDRSIKSATSADFAAINVIIKLARVATNPTHRDSWVDMAAYAAIGYECAVDVTNGPEAAMKGKD